MNYINSIPIKILTLILCVLLTGQKYQKPPHQASSTCEQSLATPLAAVLSKRGARQGVLQPLDPQQRKSLYPYSRLEKTLPIGALSMVFLAN